MSRKIAYRAPDAPYMERRIAPYRNKRTKERKKSVVFWLASIVVISGITLYVLLFARFFRIKEINVEAGERISSDSVKAATREFLGQKTLKIFLKNNYFIFSSTQAQEFLKNKFSEIKNVEVAKNIYGAVTIKIQERNGIMLYCRDNKCYEMDEDGIIFEEAPQIYGGTEACLRDDSARDIKLKDNVIEPKMAEFLLLTKKLLQERSNLNLVYFEINNYPPIDIWAITSENWKIIFDINREPENQVEALRLVLEEKIKDQRNALEYVDLRVENRVYYKIK